MARTLETKLKIESWDEKPYREHDDGRKFTKADVVLGGDDQGIEKATFESMMYYTADGTGVFLSLMEVTGTLDGRRGSFVLEGRGTYDKTTARSDYAVVPGSGTGDLAGISGEGSSTSTHEDYPNMPLTLRYDLS
jgi:hypothetical protein